MVYEDKSIAIGLFVLLILIIIWFSYQTYNFQNTTKNSFVDGATTPREHEILLPLLAW